MTPAMLIPLLAAEIPAAPVLALMAFAVLITTGGHLYKSRIAVATGLVLLFLATAGMVVGGYLAYQGGEEDVREERPRGEPSF